MFLLTLTVSASAAAGVYRWVDPHGRTHYADRPPAEGAEQLEMEAGPTAADRREAADRARRLLERDQRSTEMRRRQKTRAATESAERERASASRRRECAAARRDLAVLRQQRPVYTTDAGGRDVFLDDAQRAVMIRRLGAYVASNCVD